MEALDRTFGFSAGLGVSLSAACLPWLCDCGLLCMCMCMCMYMYMYMYVYTCICRCICP